jgi:hypothetical protein
MNAMLDAEGKALLNFLIQRLPRIDPTDPGTFVTYKEAHDALGLQEMGATIGTSLQMQGLNSMAGWAHERNLPAIAGLVVRGDTRMPGEGFFKSYGKSEISDFAWWLSEIGKSKSFDWTGYLNGNQAGRSSVPVRVVALDGSGAEIQPPSLPQSKTIQDEAKRLANLVFSRVKLSGQVVEKVAPIREAPEDLIAQIVNLLSKSPLVCALCGGLMLLNPENKLIQPSGDRKDSGKGDYGPNNYQLVHLACNLGKNSASDTDFQEWLNVIRKGISDS